MTAARRKKTAASLRPLTPSFDATDLKARFEAVTTEIATEIRKVSNDISAAVLDAVAQSTLVDDSLREAVRLAVSLKVLEQFLHGLSDRMSSSDARSSRSIPDVRKLLAELRIENGSGAE